MFADPIADVNEEGRGSQPHQPTGDRTMMNMMNEMMAKMDGDMKKQATEMMGKCKEMMAKAPPEQKSNGWA